jgi:hypothetical protein
MGEKEGRREVGGWVGVWVGGLRGRGWGGQHGSNLMTTLHLADG